MIYNILHKFKKTGLYFFKISSANFIFLVVKTSFFINFKFKAELYEAISANPLIQFNFVAEQSGTLELIWHEDGGQVYTTTRELRVL